MYHIDLRAAKAVADARVETVQGQSQAHVPLYEMGNNRSGRLPMWGYQMLYQVGQRLVALGRQLEQYGLPQPSL